VWPQIPMRSEIKLNNLSFFLNWLVQVESSEFVDGEAPQKPRRGSRFVHLLAGQWSYATGKCHPSNNTFRSSYQFFLGYHNIVEFCKQECLPGRRQHDIPTRSYFSYTTWISKPLVYTGRKDRPLYETSVDKQGSGKKKTEVVDPARSLSRPAMSVTGRMCVSIELERH
jgi:hypothetical protein